MLPEIYLEIVLTHCSSVIFNFPKKVHLNSIFYDLKFKPINRINTRFHKLLLKIKERTVF